MFKNFIQSLDNALFSLTWQLTYCYNIPICVSKLLRTLSLALNSSFKVPVTVCIRFSWKSNSNCFFWTSTRLVTGFAPPAYDVTRPAFMPDEASGSRPANWQQSLKRIILCWFPDNFPFSRHSFIKLSSFLKKLAVTIYGSCSRCRFFWVAVMKAQHKRHADCFGPSVLV